MKIFYFFVFCFLFFVTPVENAISQVQCEPIPSKQLCDMQASACYWVDGKGCVPIVNPNNGGVSGGVFPTPTPSVIVYTPTPKPCDLYATSLDGGTSNGTNYIEKISGHSSDFQVVGEWSTATEEFSSPFNDIASFSSDDIRVVTFNGFLKKLKFLNSQSVTTTNSLKIDATDSATFEGQFFASKANPNGRIVSIDLSNGASTAIGKGIQGQILDVTILNGRKYFVKVDSSNGYSRLGYIGENGTYYIINFTKNKSTGNGIRFTGIATQGNRLLGLSEDRGLYSIDHLNAQATLLLDLPDGKGRGFGLTADKSSCK
ncbi:MAG: hypothetical protein QE271_13775 [Bacteriovoracaceae bacterium]|nr:hypothetical protein [Bacteriovoracaceae bacterium]